MSEFVASQSPVSQQDVEVLIGIVAIETGNVVAGNVDPSITEKFADRFVNAGVLDREPDGSQPSAGKVGLALEDLCQRLRYAYGDYDGMPMPRPLPRVVKHVLELPSERAADHCRDDLPSGQVREAVIDYHETEGWLAYAFYPELAPDHGFHERETQLQQTATKHGGRYIGSSIPVE
ncbi:MAG: hypothetical protein ACRDPH_03120 [Marmoricola sp.]